MCSYLRDPESALNWFVQEQVDYITCNHPDLKYQDIMAKIDEDSDSVTKNTKRTKKSV